MTARQMTIKIFNKLDRKYVAKLGFFNPQFGYKSLDELWNDFNLRVLPELKGGE
jgi:hypothetical protein